MLKRNLLIASSLAILTLIPDSSDARIPRDTPGMTVNTGGFVRFEAGWVDVHTNDKDKTRELRNRKHDFNMDCTITIRADGKAENGLDYGAEVRLNATPNTTHTNIVKRTLVDGTTKSFIEPVNRGGRELINSDKVYIYAEKENFGRIEAGATDGAVLNEFIYAPASFGTGGVDGYGDDWLGDTIYATPYIPRNAGKALKVHWITPRVDGFQSAVSFTPVPSRRGRLVKRNRIVLAEPGTARLKDENFENVTEWSSNYLNSFGAVGVAVSAAYVHGNSLKSKENSYRNLRSWGFGGQISYSGFTFGGSYANNGKSGYAKSQKNNVIRSNRHEHGHSLGLEYEKGPIILGTNYMHASTAGDTTIPGRDREYALSGGMTYKIHQGFTVFTEVIGSRRDLKVDTKKRDKIVQRAYTIGSKVAW